MAEQHIHTPSIGGNPISTIERMAAVLFKLWEFVNASSLIQFVVDVTVPAVFDGTVYGTPTDQTFFENDGSRITVEPVDPTVDWQCKLKIDTVAEDLLVQYAPAGGWSNAVEFGVAPTSGEILWGVGAAPAVSSSLFISASDDDGYPYFRCVIFDTLPISAFYVGGYIPIEPTPNTQPHCLLAGLPVVRFGTAGTWGSVLGGLATSRNRVPVEYPPITTDLVANGFAFVFTANQLADGSVEQGYNGTFVQVPVFLGTNTGHCLGYFGPFTMFAISSNKADRDIDASGEYIVFNDLAMRWNPN